MLLHQPFGYLLEVILPQDIGEEAGEDEATTFGLQVPFGPMLAVGGLVYFLGFDVYVDAYFENFTNTFFCW